MARPLRIVFHERLVGIRAQLAKGSELAATVIGEATDAVLAGDAYKAQHALDVRRDLLDLAGSVEDEAMLLLALEQPVAAELREVVDALAIGSAVDRMGGLAAHVAESALRRAHSGSCVAETARETIRAMSDQAVLIATKTSTLIGDPTVRLAEEIDADDDVMDALHRRLFTQMLDPGWPAGVEGAIDVALLGRYYERFGDQAVNATRRVLHTLTGELP